MFLFFRKRKKIYPIVFEQSDFAYLYKNCPVCICELKSKPCTTLVWTQFSYRLYIRFI